MHSVVKIQLLSQAIELRGIIRQVV